MNRRQILKTAIAALPAFALRAQDAETNPWSGPVIDCHHHLRRQLESNVAHIDGCGVSNALVLARDAGLPDLKTLRARYPGRFPAWFVSADITKPESAAILKQAVQDGASGFGEIKFHVKADGPEMQRMYALAAELRVPILIHFQEVPHSPEEGVFNTGFKNFEAMLKAYPKTLFIGHADAFWANISADYKNEVAYPAGKIKRGGITDRLLADYANLYGDLSANSGNNALSRDPDFTPDFLERHQDKLIFGSDCSCSDGKGGGISQTGNPAASRLAGKCVARETLTLLKKTASDSSFRKMVWGNAHRAYQISQP